MVLLGLKLELSACTRVFEIRRTCKEMVSSDPPVEYSARNDTISLSAVTHGDRPAVRLGHRQILAIWAEPFIGRGNSNLLALSSWASSQ